jgi:hypothetical protein
MHLKSTKKGGARAQVRRVGDRNEGTTEIRRGGVKACQSCTVRRVHSDFAQQEEARLKAPSEDVAEPDAAASGTWREVQAAPDAHSSSALNAQRRRRW